MANADLTEVVHLAGIDVTFGSVRRQRCAWCGAMLLDDDLARMAWTLNEDGSDPGPPPALTVGALYSIAGGIGEGFRGLRLVPDEMLEDSIDGEGKRAPDNACLQLDPAATR